MYWKALWVVGLSVLDQDPQIWSYSNWDMDLNSFYDHQDVWGRRGVWAGRRDSEGLLVSSLKQPASDLLNPNFCRWAGSFSQTAGCVRENLLEWRSNLKRKGGGGSKREWSPNRPFQIGCSCFKKILCSSWWKLHLQDAAIIHGVSFP